MTQSDLGQALISHIRNALGRRRGAGPLVIGLTGGVAVGKSTLARFIAEGLGLADPSLSTEVIATDGFLRPNAELEAAGLGHRKGFPESFDTDAFHAFLGELGAGGPVSAPVYSHVTYDVSPDERRTISGVDVVIVEGVNVLQTAAARANLDVMLYLDAEVELVKGWFADRLHRIAATEPASFMAQFSDPAARAAVIEYAWNEINLPNLREHIAPTATFADLVARKGEDHAIVALEARA